MALVLTAACTSESFGLESRGSNPSELLAVSDPATGLPLDIETHVKGQTRRWLAAPATLSVRKETTGVSASPARGKGSVGDPVRSPLAPLGLVMTSHWSREGPWLVWDLDFNGDVRRSGQTVQLDLPVLDPALRVFTPGDRGVVDLSLLPTFAPASYGLFEYFSKPDGRSYVLPLVSVFDPSSDSALTVALPPDGNIPHFQVEWIGARTLRLTLAHRGMGGGKPSPLRILFATHPADYRSTLAAYAARYPRYFEPPLPRGDCEGSFYYHHIQNHPDFAEMERQNVRFIWSSFWFTHVGEFLPAEREWYPFTYAKLFNLHEMMTDQRIVGFIDEMHRRRIGVFAYFNVTEYGGNGGQGGDAAEANRRLREQFANALIKDENGKSIPTWEGALAMNPRRRYALWPVLEEQIHRHLARLPGFDGFVIDRLDWASSYDYGHDDGLTMVGDRPVDNMAGAVSEALGEVTRLSHAAGKRMFVNQFTRVDVLRDIDGTCHESDYLPQRYLIPFRPAAAWQMVKPYVGKDLTSFEAQFKQRLQIALMPQMIAHRFPISQQAPGECAADLQELFTPLFAVYAGKRQVLQAHCIAATGANDVNLFTDAGRRYLVPVTSRTRFVTRGDRGIEPVTVTISTTEAQGMTWAHAIPLGEAPYRAKLKTSSGQAVVTATRHGTATMLVVGSGHEPPLADNQSARLVAVRDARFPERTRVAPPSTSPPTGPVIQATLQLGGTNFYHPGPFVVQLDSVTVGTLNGNHASFSCTIRDLARPTVRIVAADEGAWYLPDRVRLTAQAANHTLACATWEPGDEIQAGGTLRELILPLHWRTRAATPAPAVSSQCGRGGLSRPLTLPGS